jgi:dienelactone hydrolase
MPQFECRDIDYFHDGIRMVGCYCAPEMDDAAKPGILVVHGAHGLDGQIIACAGRIAALGYAVLAVDLWGERKLLKGDAEIGPTLGRFLGDRSMWMGRLEAARQVLAAQPGVDADQLAAVGYCFGGASVLEFIRADGALRGVASIHGGLDLVADDWSRARPETRVLVCTGAEDPMAPPAILGRLQQGLTAAGIRWEVDLYGGARHAFTEPDRPDAPPFAAYDAMADRRSWNATRAFLDEIFAV